MRKAKDAPAVRVLRLRYASLRMTALLNGLLLSDPFANCASGWGTRFRTARREGGPCLRKAKGAPAVRVLRLRYAALRMTTALGDGVLPPTLLQIARKDGAPSFVPVDAELQVPPLRSATVGMTISRAGDVNKAIFVSTNFCVHEQRGCEKWHERRRRRVSLDAQSLVLLFGAAHEDAFDLLLGADVYPASQCRVAGFEREDGIAEAKVAELDRMPVGIGRVDLIVGRRDGPFVLDDRPLRPVEIDLAKPGAFGGERRLGDGRLVDYVLG